MNWFLKMFKREAITSKKTENKYTNNYFKGRDAYKTGVDLFNEYTFTKPISSERKKQKLIAALEFFDKAIENGYDDSEALTFRGMCLRDLNYDLDALDDFNKCIEINPTKASYYYNRAITKQFMYDFDASVEDFKKAIELSKLDNEDTRYWNEYAKQTGYSSGTAKYELDLSWVLEDKERAQESQVWQDIIKSNKENMKRRFK